jgi:hypothetical protein
MAGIIAQANNFQNEYFPEPFISCIQYPAPAVCNLVQQFMQNNPNTVRTDAVLNGYLFVRQPGTCSPLYCRVMELPTPAAGIHTYRLRDEIRRHHNSQLQIADTVNPDHAAYNRVRNMNRGDAHNALYSTLQRLYGARRRVGTNTRYGRRIVFRYMVYAYMIFDRIDQLYRQEGKSAIKGANTSRCLVAHLLDILHGFYRTYPLFNRTLHERGLQAMIQPTQDSMIEFIIASVALRMGYGHEFKISQSANSLNTLDMDPHVDDNSKISKAFVDFITHHFHPNYVHAFKGHKLDALSCNMKNKRTELIQKKNEAMTSVHNVDNISSSSLHLFYPHYRACNALWQGFEKNFFNNAKNVPGVPSRPNAFNAADRFPGLNNEDKIDLATNTETLWHLFRNKKSKNKSPWM